MKRSICVQLLESEVLFLVLARGGAVAQAQVENIDPNPTMPRDVGGSLTNRAFSDSRFRLGRTSVRDDNPAETLLKSMNGTNYGRATGHSLFSRSTIDWTTSEDMRRRLSYSPEPANKYFTQPGSYRGRVDQRAHGNAERQRNYPNQTLGGHRSTAKSASPTTKRHAAAAGTPHSQYGQERSAKGR